MRGGSNRWQGLGLHHYCGLTFFEISFQIFEEEKVTTRRAGIRYSSLVFGLRPILAGLFRTLFRQKFRRFQIGDGRQSPFQLAKRLGNRQLLTRMVPGS